MSTHVHEAGIPGLAHRPPLGGEASRNTRLLRSAVRGRQARRGWPTKLREYERKRDPQRTPEPFTSAPKRRGRGADLRRPAPRRAAPPLRLPARARRRARVVGGAEGRAARAGRARPRRARRGSPARLRDLRGRDPEGRATAAARSRSGTAARTSSSRRSPTAGSPSACTASGSRARGRSSRRSSTAKEKNWLLFRKRDDDAPAPGLRNDYRPMLATLAETAARAATTGCSRSSGTATARSGTCAAARRGSSRGTATT